MQDKAEKECDLSSRCKQHDNGKMAMTVTTSQEKDFDNDNCLNNPNLKFETTRWKT